MEETPISIARPKLAKSSFMPSTSPSSARLTPGGRFASDGSFSASASTSPSARPFNSSSMNTLRLRSYRSICAGPDSIPTVATLSSITLPARPGTGAALAAALAALREAGVN